MSALDDAVDQAVRAGLLEVRTFRVRVDQALRTLDTLLADLSVWCEPSEALGATPLHPADQLHRRFIQEVRQLRQSIQTLFAEQEAELSYVNIVVFGRSGVGKSCLVEALSHGNAARVSPSQSDYTTDVEAATWGRCRISDTPGVKGSGRIYSREDLGQKARRAVAFADIVLLVFDSYNQEADIFLEVAQAVHALGKPVIVVLNVRRARWRQPEALPQSQRFAQSHAVRQHVARIRQELSRIGLDEVAVVAVHSQRALFGRATEPILGPEGLAERLREQRAAHGAAHLTACSNLPALEDLLATMLQESALDLRRSMLSAEVGGLLTKAGNYIPETSDIPKS